MVSKNTFDISGDTVTIRYPGTDWMPECTLIKEYMDELTTHTWYLKNGYPYNQSLGGGLHRYVMRKYYGEKAYKEFCDNGFVIEHMNNRHTDCRLCNLEFIRKQANTGKGMWIDPDIKDITPHLGLKIYKDYKTGLYQTTIACNDPIEWRGDDGQRIIPSTVKLLYEKGVDRYETVILDAEKIIKDYLAENKIVPERTSAACVRIYKALLIHIDPKVRETLQRNNNRRGLFYRVAVHYDENWTIPEEYDSVNKIYEFIDP